MIDYSERVEEVQRLLSASFGVNDPQLVEILLAAQLNVPSSYPWLVLETDFYSLDTFSTWFSFGTDWVRSLAALRAQRPRAVNQEIEALLTAPDRARLFIESSWESPAEANYHATMMPYLRQNCLHARTKNPKVLPPDDRTLLMLKEAARRALDCQFRRDPVAAKPPVSLPYWCELLVRLAPGLRDWNTLIQNLSSLATRRAYLFNRPTDETDWQAVVRVMRDSVPAWTKEIVETIQRCGRTRSLKAKYRPPLLKAELERLVFQGVFYSHSGEWLMRGAEAEDTLLLMRGEVEL